MTRIKAVQVAPKTAFAAGTAPRPRRGLRRRSPLTNALLFVGVLFFVIFTLYPLVYMVSGSFKTLGETYSGFASLWPQNPTLENYNQVLFQGVLDQTNFLRNCRNSLGIAAMTIGISLLMALPAAFVIARHTNVAATLVSVWIRIAQVVGGIIVIIPLYLILREIGLVDTLLGVSLAQSIPFSAFATWVLVSYIRQIPSEIEEAARLDGCHNWQVIRHVVLPLIRPGLLSVILVVFFLSWNDFINPLILINDPDYYTVTVALFTFIGQVGQVDWGTLLAFGTLACLPGVVMIILAERHLVSGLLGGSVK